MIPKLFAKYLFCVIYLMNSSRIAYFSLKSWKLIMFSVFQDLSIWPLFVRVWIIQRSLVWPECQTNGYDWRGSKASDKINSWIPKWWNELMHEERLGKLSLIPLSYRHEMKDLLFLHGCAFGKYNLDLSDFLQKKKYMSTRSSPDSFLILKCRTQTFKRSFFVRTARLRNTLPTSTQSQK